MQIFRQMIIHVCQIDRQKDGHTNRYFYRKTDREKGVERICKNICFSYIYIFIEQRQKYTHLRRKSDRMALSVISHYSNNFALKHFKLLDTLKT